MWRGWWWKVAVVVALVAAWRGWQGSGWDKEAAFKFLRDLSEKLGIWAIPLYVSVHTISIALCLPSAIFFETAAPLLFGFFPSVFCVFSAKILAASLSFSLGRFNLFFFFSYFHSFTCFYLLRGCWELINHDYDAKAVTVSFLDSHRDVENHVNRKRC